MLNLNEQSIKELYEKMGNEFEFVKMFLDVGKIPDDKIIEVISYVKDKFLRLTLFNKLVYGVPEKEQCIEQIEEYQRIMAGFLSLGNDEKERTEYLNQLKPKDKTPEAYTQINNIKMSLLDYIREPKNREEIIAGMKAFIGIQEEGKIQEVSNQPDSMLAKQIEIAKAIIISFFSSQGELSNEQLERLNMALNSVNIVATDDIRPREGADTQKIYMGVHEITKRIIGISKKDLTRERKLFTLHNLIHELGHEIKRSGIQDIMTDSTWIFDCSDLGADIEEGVVDIFASKVMDVLYKLLISKNIPVKPYKSDAYELNVSIIGTILGTMSVPGQDMLFFKEFFLGNLAKSYEMIGKANLQRTLPEGSFQITRELLSMLQSRIEQGVINKGYFQNNLFLSPLTYIMKYSKDKREIVFNDILKLYEKLVSNDKNYRKGTGNIYFSDALDNRKIYQVPFETFETFMTESKNLKISNLSIQQYFLKQFNSLSHEEAKDNSEDLIKKLILLFEKNDNEKWNFRMPKEFVHKVLSVQESNKIENEEDFQKQMDLFAFLMRQRNISEKTGKEANASINVLGLQRQLAKKLEGYLNSPGASAMATGFMGKMGISLDDIVKAGVAVDTGPGSGASRC